jgi:uncharacterized protein (DUF433 family)
MLGKPVIRGTRIPVELVLCKLGEGATETDLPDAYSRLSSNDIRAALAYAVDALAHETILPEPAATAPANQAFLQMKAATSP